MTTQDAAGTAARPVVETDDELAAVRGLLRATPGAQPGRLADLGARLVELVAERAGARRQETAARFASLERIRAGQDRLRALSTIADLLPAAARELGTCCGFDRTALFQVTGSTWRLGALWVGPGDDPDLGRWLTRRITGRTGPPVAAELAGRRTAVLVDPTAAGASRRRSLPVRGPLDGLMAGAPNPGFVAGPILAGERVIGYLQAGCVRSGRRLGPPDLENLTSFADGFGPVFERTASLERARGHRVGLRDQLAALERQLRGLGVSEPRLVRGEPPTVGGIASRRPHRRTALDRLLTERERQVVELMVGGARNRHMADRLAISEETVKSHVRSITRKLGASGRADVVASYLRLRGRAGP
jgi:LuxR family transcriptional regulator, regulator of acetate metabolism